MITRVRRGGVSALSITDTKALLHLRVKSLRLDGVAKWEQKKRRRAEWVKTREKRSRAGWDFSRGRSRRIFTRRKIEALRHDIYSARASLSDRLPSPGMNVDPDRALVERKSQLSFPKCYRSFVIAFDFFSFFVLFSLVAIEFYYVRTNHILFFFLLRDRSTSLSKMITLITLMRKIIKKGQ